MIVWPTTAGFIALIGFVLGAFGPAALILVLTACACLEIVPVVLRWAASPNEGTGS